MRDRELSELHDRLRQLNTIDAPTWEQVVEITELVHEIERRRKP